MGKDSANGQNGVKSETSGLRGATGQLLVGPMGKRVTDSFGRSLNANDMADKLELPVNEVLQLFNQLPVSARRSIVTDQLYRTLYLQLSNYEKHLAADTVTDRTLAVGVEKFLHQLNLMTGEATARVEHVRREINHADVGKYLLNLPSANPEK